MDNTKDSMTVARISMLLEQQEAGGPDAYAGLVAALRDQFLNWNSASRSQRTKYFPVSRLRETCRQYLARHKVPPNQLLAFHLASTDALLSAMSLHSSSDSAYTAKSIGGILSALDRSNPGKALLFRLHYVAGLNWDDIGQIPAAQETIGDPVQMAVELRMELEAAGLSQEALHKHNLQPKGDITLLLEGVIDGERPLSEVVAGEQKRLRQQAAYLLRMEAGNISLQATELVNEIFLRLPRDAAKAPVNHLELDGLIRILMSHILTDRSRKKTPGRSTNRAELREDLRTRAKPMEDQLFVEKVLRVTHEVLQELRQTNPESAEMLAAVLFRSANQQDLARLHSLSLSGVKRRIKDGRDLIRERLGLE